MAEEMISGPDLGGGYLHQLTVDGSGPGSRFTFHAQVGGPDASGPPLGSLEPLGFVHPTNPCSFGGPRCFHRSFETDPQSAPRVRLAYNRMRFVLAALLEQLYAARLPTVDAALTEVAARLGEAKPTDPSWWYVGGSTAAWLQGAAVLPNDIDLGSSPKGAERIAESLKEYLVEPWARTTWSLGGPRLAARAFVGTMRDGARVEWTEGDPAGAPSFSEWGGDPRRVRTRTVLFHDRPIVVSRLEYALVRALEAGRKERVRVIREAIRPLGVDRELLSALLERSALPSEERAATAASLSP